MKTSTEIKLLIQKFARLARCPSARIGEAVNAAAMAVKFARKNNIDLSGYSDLVAMASATDSKPPSSTPPISKPWNSGKPVVKPCNPPPIEEPSVSRQWDSKQPEPKPPFTKPPYTSWWSPNPPRAKRKQSKPHTLLSVMPGGWYRGKTFEEIYKIAPEYLVWFPKAHRTQTTINESIFAFLKTKQPS